MRYRIGRYTREVGTQEFEAEPGWRVIQLMKIDAWGKCEVLEEFCGTLSEQESYHLSLQLEPSLASPTSELPTIVSTDESSLEMLLDPLSEMEQSVDIGPELQGQQSLSSKENNDGVFEGPSDRPPLFDQRGEDVQAEVNAESAG